MSAVTPAGGQPYYFVPAPSRHPAGAAFGLLLVIFGASQWINGADWGKWILLAGLIEEVAADPGSPSLARTLH